MSLATETFFWPPARCFAMNSGAITLSGNSTCVSPSADSPAGGGLSQPRNSLQAKTTRPAFIAASSRLSGMDTDAFLVSVLSISCRTASGQVSQSAPTVVTTGSATTTGAAACGAGDAGRLAAKGSGGAAGLGLVRSCVIEVNGFGRPGEGAAGLGKEYDGTVGTAGFCHGGGDAGRIGFVACGCGCDGGGGGVGAAGTGAGIGAGAGVVAGGAPAGAEMVGTGCLGSKTPVTSSGTSTCL